MYCDQKKIFEIDGNRFSTLVEFWDEIDRELLQGVNWGRNLDAFNDILCGGFGTPEEGFILYWKNSDISRLRLGYEQTIRFRERSLDCCHPSNREKIEKEIDEARRFQGQTLFDILVEIIHRYREGEIENYEVKLVLE